VDPNVGQLHEVWDKAKFAKCVRRVPDLTTLPVLAPVAAKAKAWKEPPKTNIFAGNSFGALGQPMDKGAARQAKKTVEMNAPRPVLTDPPVAVSAAPPAALPPVVVAAAPPSPPVAFSFGHQPQQVVPPVGAEPAEEPKRVRVEPLPGPSCNLPPFKQTQREMLQGFDPAIAEVAGQLAKLKRRHVVAEDRLTKANDRLAAIVESKEDVTGQVQGDAMSKLTGAIAALGRMEHAVAECSSLLKQAVATKNKALEARGHEGSKSVIAGLHAAVVGLVADAAEVWKLCNCWWTRGVKQRAKRAAAAASKPCPNAPIVDRVRAAEDFQLKKLPARDEEVAGPTQAKKLKVVLAGAETLSEAVAQERKQKGRVKVALKDLVFESAGKKRAAQSKAVLKTEAARLAYLEDPMPRKYIMHVLKAGGLSAAPIMQELSELSEECSCWNLCWWLCSALRRCGTRGCP
jgi:hypothetical protein